MPYMTNDQADALLARGAISPDTHAMIVTQNAPNASLAPPPEPFVPPAHSTMPNAVNPLMPQNVDPLEAAVGAANAGRPLPEAPRSPPAAGEPVGAAAFLPAMQAATPPPGAAPAEPPGPRGEVLVGPSTPVAPTALMPASSGRAVGGPPRSSGMQDMAKAQIGALEAQKGAVGELNRLGQQRQLDDERIRADQQAQLDQKRVLEMAAKQEEDAHRDELVRDRENAIADYRNARVDPTQVAKSRGVFGTILAAIAMGAGAFGASITHGPNYAQQILDKQVDDNIRAQEADIAKKGKTVDMKSNTLAQYRQITGDNEAARAALKADLLTQQRDELAANIQKYGSAEQQARGQQMLADITGKIGETNAAVKMAMEKQATAQAAANMAQKRALEGKVAETAKDLVLKGQDPVEAMRNATALHTGRVVGSAPLQALPESPEYARNRREAAKDSRERTVTIGGQPYETSTEDDAKQLKKIIIPAETAIGALRELKALRQKVGSETGLTGPEKKRAALLSAQVVLSYKNIGELGVLSKSDEDLIEPFANRDALDVSSRDSTVDANLDSAISATQGMLQNHVDARVRPGSPKPSLTNRAQTDAAGVGFTPNK